MKSNATVRWMVCLAAVVCLATGTARAADEPLADAKALYAAASFEDALAALGKLDPSGAAEPAALEYKALCLLALGRASEAQAATAALVSAAPSYQPSDTDLSPRYLTLFTETRRQLLPTIAKRLFSDAREHFRAKDQKRALVEFETVLTLANDPLWKDTADAGDLRTLASGFADLATATVQPVAPPPPVAVAPAPVAAAPPAAAPAVARAPVVTPPVPIRQMLPRWNPPDQITAKREFNGLLRVVVAKDGTVSRATIERPTHPLYDTLVLEAARTWLYQPGTRNGQPIEMERMLTLQLKTN